MSLVILFHFLCAQHVSDINISIIRSLRLFCWITTLVVCSWVDVCWSFGVADFSLQHWYHSNTTTPASACNTDTTPTQPHQLQPATQIPLQPNHTGFSLQHGYHSKPTTPASACNTDTTPTQPHRLQPATLIPLEPNHTETPTHIEPRTIRPMW